MQIVQRFIFIILMMLLLASISIAGEKTTETAQPSSATLVNKAKLPISLKSGDYDLISSIFEFAPRAVVPRHIHGGYVLVLVLSGEVTLYRDENEIILKQGESWTETPGYVHSLINNGKVTARIAVSMIVPKGAEPTTFIKP